MNNYLYLCAQLLAIDMSNFAFLIYFFVAINVISFLIYGIDKLKAVKGWSRISEATLLWIAVLGGSIGAWAGMLTWHHKTKHLKFQLGVPFILLLQLALAICLYFFVLNF